MQFIKCIKQIRLWIKIKENKWWLYDIEPFIENKKRADNKCLIIKNAESAIKEPIE